jgi:DNA polymerase III subunit gamma/tau
MTQALYRKWRPRRWDEVIAQEHVITTLKNAIVGDRVGHAYLFSGPRGTGKTTAARLLAKAVNCLHESLAERPCDACAHCTAVNENRFMDLIEIDAASNTSVEDVRDLRDKINFAPTQGKFKIYIIDEVHMLSTAAFNALLKTLEEPPPHAIFILATTEMHKIPATVISRCQRHEFRRVPVIEITKHLQSICESEQIPADPEALTAIARTSSGGMRDAISLLDQLASTGDQITLELVQTVLGTATSQTVLDVLGAVLAEDSGRALESLHRALDSGADPRSLARQVVEYLRGILLIQMGNGDQVETSAEVRDQMTRHATALDTNQTLRMMKIFNNAAMDVRGGWSPSLGLELALAESMEAPAPAPASVIETRAAPRVAAPAPSVTPNAPAGAPAEGASAPEPVRQESAFSVKTISDAWRQIRAVIKPQNPSLDGLLNSCTRLDEHDGALVLGFSTEVLRSKMDKPENLDLTRKAIAKVTGLDVPLRCAVTGVSAKTPAHVSPDGMVSAALQNGGEIVDVS